jgi:type IV pilus biogenesis protein CpaD/CtpE
VSHADAVLALALAALLAGCASDQEGGAGDLPQAQPAHWEGGVPGLTPGGPPR